jgi:acetyl-CoA decarbonylase/synthase complex subunit beta
MNSFGTCPKGEPIDAAAGEWSGVNEAVTRLTGGRTTRVQLHSLAEAPHTGCGCFRLIMFRMTTRRPGIGIMDRTYKAAAPDGRTWRDLHYALGGKQAVGLAGATPAYLKSPKFLVGDGGWKSVVWVSPKIAEVMGDLLPKTVEVGVEIA